MLWYEMHPNIFSFFSQGFFLFELLEDKKQKLLEDKKKKKKKEADPKRTLGI